MSDAKPDASVRSYSTSRRSDLVESWSSKVAFVITALFFAAELSISTKRMFWFDEVFTTFSTRLAGWADMWRAVTGAADPTPFGYFAIARISDQLLGPGEIGIRLPSLVATAIGFMVTYSCARKLTGSFHALLSIALLLCSCLVFYASEGRPYGIYFLCSALALWSWLRRSAWAIGGVFLAGTFIHFYMVFSLVPFVALEALEWRPWNWPSKTLRAAALGAILSLAVQLPHMTANWHFYHETFWASPELRAAVSVYDRLFPHVSWCLALMLAGGAMFAAKKTECPRMSDGERVGWLFALIPMVGWVCAIVVTNAFTPRYFINSIPGIAVAFACLICRVFGGKRRIGAYFCVLLVCFGGSRIVWSTRYAEEIDTMGTYQAEVRDVLGHEEQTWFDGKKVTLMPKLLVLPAIYYSNHPERYITWSPERPPSDAIVPAWFTDRVVERAREIAFVNPEWRLLEKLRKANLKLSVRTVRSVALVYAE
jgi:hypothetical protein